MTRLFDFFKRCLLVVLVFIPIATIDSAPDRPILYCTCVLILSFLIHKIWKSIQPTENNIVVRKATYHPMVAKDHLKHIDKAA